MSFPVNINFNIDKSHTVKNGTRSAIINHERRVHGYTKNPSIDYNLSKFNDYNNLLNYNNEIQKIVEPYIRHHNNLKSVKQNPNRKIKSVHELLEKRGKRIPYKYVVIKFGDGSTRKNLLLLFKRNGLTRADYAQAINLAFLNYAKNYNATHKHLAFDHEDSNLDEINRFGGDHAHLGTLANSKTKSGKQSLSFDRATKVEYGGRTNIAAWHIMQQQEAKSLIHYANQSFQRYLGKGFTFKLTRNPHSNLHLKHDKYIQVQEANDKLRATNKQLLKAIISSKQEAEDLASSSITVKDYNSLIDKANQIVNSTRLKNIKLKIRIHKAKMCNSSLQRTINKELMQWGYRNRKLVKNYRMLVKINSILVNRNQRITKNLKTLTSNNNRWEKTLPQLKNQLSHLKDIVPYLTSLEQGLKQSKPLSIDMLAKLKFESESSKKN